MARIRSLHPGQPTDEDFVAMSFAARLFALHLRCEADDNGVFEWKPVALKMRLFPVDNVDIEGLLAELATNKQVASYEVDGRKYGVIRNFRKWQKPKTPNSVHPLPAELRTYAGLKADGSETSDDKPEQFPQIGEMTPLDREPSPPKEETARQREEGGDSLEEGGGSSAPNGAVVGATADPTEPDYFKIPDFCKKATPEPITKAFDNYNIAAGEFGLPLANKLTEDRKRKLRQRLKEHGLEGWNKALETIGDSPFLRGDNDRGWRADFDFLLQPKSFNRLIEGAYKPDEGAK